MLRVRTRFFNNKSELFVLKVRKWFGEKTRFKHAAPFLARSEHVRRGERSCRRTQFGGNYVPTIVSITFSRRPI